MMPKMIVYAKYNTRNAFYDPLILFMYKDATPTIVVKLRQK